MNADMLFVFALIAVAAALMASNRVRFDIVALLVVIALMLSGVLTVTEALAGFGSSVVMLVAGLLVVGEMLDRTGVAAAIGDWILKKGGTSETRLLVVAILYVLVLGRKLLPAVEEGALTSESGRSLFELWEDFRLDRDYQPLQLTADSPLAGKTIAESGLAREYDIRVLGILRHTSTGEDRIVTPAADVEIEAADTLFAVGKPRDLERLAAEQQLNPQPGSNRSQQRWLWELGGASVLVHPESGLVGKSLREVMFRSRFHLHVLGLRRDRRAVADYEDIKLAASDNLLVMGPWSQIQQLQTRHHDFVVLETPTEQAEVVPAYRRMPLALVILAAMVLLSIFNLVPLVAVVLMAALAAVFSGCLTMEDSYRAIHWSSLVLVAGMLPLADALEKTGGTQLIVDALMYGVGDAGPHVMMSVLFFLTAALGLFLSNTASAVLVAPIAIYAAEALGVSPYPFAIAVLIAASAAFITPVSTPVVTLVVEPGRYQFTDFVKVGVPLLLLTYAVTLLVAPMIFPFTT